MEHVLRPEQVQVLKCLLLGRIVVRDHLPELVYLRIEVKAQVGRAVEVAHIAKYTFSVDFALAFLLVRCGIIGYGSVGLILFSCPDLCEFESY